MRIEIAICTWNRCELLAQTLEGITQLIVPPDIDWSVTVVNNNSSDRTDEVITAFSGRLNLKRLFEPVPGLSNARNRVLADTSADVIAWTDDDVLVERSWLSEMVGAVRRHPNASGFGGPIEPWFPKPPDADLMVAFPILARGFCAVDHGIDERTLPDGEFVWGANMAYRTARTANVIFDTSLGPSPTSLSGSDDAMFQHKVRASGGQIVWCPKVRVKHYVEPSRMTLPYLMKYTLGKGRENPFWMADNQSPRLYGVPRWLLREWGVTRIKSVIVRYSPVSPELPTRLRSTRLPPARGSRKLARLQWVAEEAYLRGMMIGYRELTGSAASTRSAP